MADRQGKVEFVLTAADEGSRLDQVLARHLPALSRRRARVLLDIGGVFVNNVRTKQASRTMRTGAHVAANLGGAFARATKHVGQHARAQDAASLPAYHVVFEDSDLVVVEKPPGLLTAPTPESDRGNLADALARRQPGPKTTLYVVHRIDLQTSGLLVFAKTDEANRVLSERFRVHDVEREYGAVVAGHFPDEVSRLDGPVGGRSAVTHVEAKEHLGALATVLRCRLETGRTHQIRIHVSALGHPVLGDPEQEDPGLVEAPPRMALHAAKLGFVHPITGERLLFETPWPADLAAWLTRLRAAGS